MPSCASSTSSKSIKGIRNRLDNSFPRTLFPEPKRPMRYSFIALLDQSQDIIYFGCVVVMPHSLHSSINPKCEPQVGPNDGFKYGSICKIIWNRQLMRMTECLEIFTG